MCHRHRRDAGQTTLEYAAIIGMVAALIVVIGAADLGPKIGDGFASAVCRILQQDGCEGGERGGPSADDPRPGEPGDDTGDPDGPDVLPDAAGVSDKDDYRRRLCRELGLDCEGWDTSEGLSCNDRNIVPVYEYYADISRDHPELQWAGMAKLAGGLVYAGMQDLHVLRNMTDTARRAHLRELVPGMPGFLVDELVNATDDELRYWETKFVDMQKQIFDDLGWQHAAYVQGGIKEMRRLDREGQLPAGMLDAWEDIASGDPERIAAGNKELLYREQKIILQDDYDEMKDHNGAVGLAVTYMLGATAESPVPGGKPFRDVVDDVNLVPEQVCAPFGGPCVDVPFEWNVDMPFPTGNIATFDSRWKWITEDMLPKYQEGLAEDPDGMRREIDRPLGERADDYRLIPVGYDPEDGVC